MNFISTRGREETVSAAKAIINGIANDGGLYVPDKFPNIYYNLKKENKISYIDLSYKIIKEFFGDIGEENLKRAINNAYNNKFFVKEENDFLELYHGPTSAFKDAALLFLPQIMKEVKKISNIKEKIVILTATSGDTGKAAMQGFSDIDGFKVVVYYPENGVSAIQKQQMVIQEGNNVEVIGVRGNFDNAQSEVKNIFGDIEFKKKLKKMGFLLSSANSINIGRLIPQIVYYFYGYFELINKQKIKEGNEINIVVPTGNFGNILAAYYAKKMGLPIGRLICSSNENNVLTDFFNTGIYDKRRELILTESPSMDILISSNLERLIFEVNNRDGEKTKNLMESLKKRGVYSISNKSKNLLKDFYANYANTKEVHKAIREVYKKENYLMDTHTAVGYVVFNKYKNEVQDNRQSLIVATASPYKFPKSICNSLGLDISNKNDFEILSLLNKYTNIEIPNNLKNLNTKKAIHNKICDKGKMKESLIEFLKENKID